MATRELNVVITGDARRLSSAVTKADRDLGSLDNRTKRTARGFIDMGTAVKTGLGVVAGAAIVKFGKDIISAAADAEASQAKVRRSLENSGISWKEHGKQIDAVIQKHAALTGFDDEELAESFANMVRTTKDVNKAFELNALAADVARTKGVGLAAAQ